MSRFPDHFTPAYNIPELHIHPDYTHLSTSSHRATAKAFNSNTGHLRPFAGLKRGPQRLKTEDNTRPNHKATIFNMTSPLHVRSVVSMLQRPLRRQHGLRQGRMYVLYDPVSGHVKLGRTRAGVMPRLRDTRQNHGRPDTFFVFETPLMDAGELHRLELLVHHDLRPYRRVYTCHCTRAGRQHREWFNVSVHRACKTILLWWEFLTNRKPYATNGCLKPFWYARISGALVWLDRVDSYASRRAMWRRITMDPIVLH